MLKPRPVPLPTGLVVKNGSKMRSTDLGRHSASRVGHLDDGVGPAGRSGMERWVIGVELRPARRNRSLPPFGMASPRVDRDVHERRFELLAVDEYGLRHRAPPARRP